MSDTPRDNVASPLRRAAGAVLDLLKQADCLVYAPIELQRQYASTKGPCGGTATLLIPVILTIVFALIYTTNQNIPDASQSSVVDLTQSAPLQLQISCTTADSNGNANPFCPGLSREVLPSPAGFEFVPSISDTPCQRGIPRMSDRVASQPWLDPGEAGPGVYTSPAFLSVEQAMGVPTADIAGRTDPYQLETFPQLAKDLSIVPGITWAGAGRSIPAVPRTNAKATQGVAAAAAIARLRNVSALSTDAATRAKYPYLQRTDLVRELELADLSDPRRDPLAAAAAAAAVLHSRTVKLDQPLPLCPFPDMYVSGSLSASPPAAGLGFIVTLPPYFNWSAFLSSGDNGAAKEASSLIQFSLVSGGSAPSSLLPAAGLSLTIVKGPSTIGGSSFGDLLQMWLWYANTMSWSESPALTLPFMSYDVDVTRNIFANGSVKFDAIATATLGLLSHGDASNYYGWGDFSTEAIPHLAACGDLYAATPADLLELFHVAKDLGFTGTWGDFVADSSWALADLLPSTAVNFSHGCGNAAASLEGWPRPACEAAQALRAAWQLGGDEGDEPLLFNVTNSSVAARLRSVYARIQQHSDAFIHKSLLPWAVTNPDVIATKNGWQAARAHANSMSAMMQAQHGCGLYCAEPIALGIGIATVVWTTPTAALNEPTPDDAAATPNRSAVIYVQRARPSVICDGTSFSLPWTRSDPSEYFWGDNSLLHMSAGANGWRTARLSAPAAAVLFRSSSWTDIRWSSSRQSPLALIGASLGYAGLLFTIFRLAKEYLHHHAVEHASTAAAIATAIVTSSRRLVITGGQRSSVVKTTTTSSPDTGHSAVGGSEVIAAPEPPAGEAEPPAPPRLAWAAPPAAAEEADAAESQGLPAAAAAAPAHYPWLLRRAERGGDSGRSGDGGVLPPHAMPDDASSSTAAAAGATLAGVPVTVDIISPDASSVSARGPAKAPS